MSLQLLLETVAHDLCISALGASSFSIVSYMSRDPTG